MLTRNEIPGTRHAHHVVPFMAKEFKNMQKKFFQKNHRKRLGFFF